MNKKTTKKTKGKPFASLLEMVRFRQNVARANKRIARLEKEGLEPSILSFVKSALGDKIRIPRGKALTELEYNKIKAITERFLNAKSSKLKVAREGERKHREAFREQVLKALGEDTNQDIIDKLYDAIGDIEVKELLSNYVYGEVLIAASQLMGAGLTLQKSLIEDVIQTNIGFVVADELNKKGIPTDGTTIRDYVEIAIQYGIDEAERQYNEDVRDETL